MDYLAQIYPPLQERLPLPSLYIPTAFALFAFTPLIPGKTSRTLIILPILFLLTAGAPFYTTGSVGDDYGLAITLLGLLLAYVDFFVLCPLIEGEGVRFTAHLSPGRTDAGIAEDDCTNGWEKLKWGARLIASPRAIGWNVQVGGVPDHPLAHGDRWTFVWKTVLRALLSEARILVSVFVIGFALTARDAYWSHVAGWEMDILVGWAGASWFYNGLEVLYCILAALTVAVGLFEPWEWPPLFGSLAEAWSVRQMWGSVWHQLLRRNVQEPGVRLSRLLNLRKGGLASNLLQICLAFTITFLIHEWHYFSALRRDVGEFHFFLIQPAAFIAEGMVQLLWRRYFRPYGSPNVMNFIGRVVGYMWTFAWFSYCLPPYVEALIGVKIIGAGFGGPVAMDLGRQAAFMWLD